MIPQDALRALNPVLRIDRQVGEPYVLHRQSAWEAARAKAVDLLASVHLRAPAAGRASIRTSSRAACSSGR